MKKIIIVARIFLQQQRPQMGQMDSEFTSSGEYRQTSTDLNTWDNQSSDPDLSDILDQVIEFVPDEAITGIELIVVVAKRTNRI